MLEEFALAQDRASVLKKLIPGTEEYYYYHVLYYQTTNRLADASKMIDQWVAQHGRTGLASKMLYRQTLLSYEQQPDASRDFLVRELGIPLNHELPTTARERRLPSQVDEVMLDEGQLVQGSIAAYGNLSQVTNLGLLRLDGATLSIPQLRELLNRYPLISEPRLVAWIARELGDRESRGFGSLAIHNQLTLAQLEELQKLRPELASNQQFVQAKIARISPSADVDMFGQPAEWLEYLKRLEAMTRSLPPAFRSLRAGVLYQLLDALRREGKYDRELFIAYLQLPRQVFYIQPRLLEQAGGAVARLDQDLRSIVPVPPIGNDEPLVREYLEQFLREAKDPSAFAAYFNEEYLQRVFIETKILYGVGDSGTWFRQLPAEAQKELRERVLLDWTVANKRFLDNTGPVRLDVDVKNVDRLTVRVFRVNLPAYYRQSQQPVNTDVDLDGLVAATQWEETYDQAAWLRHRETIELKSVTGRGVWIVDLVGGGRRSRAMVSRGDLRVMQDKSVSGHRFTVLDEDNAPVADAKLLVAGQEFAANERGQIVVPYVDAVNLQNAVVVSGEFAKLVQFVHEQENYALQGSFLLNREGLQAGEQTTLLARANLLLNGRPVSVKHIEDPVLTLVATDFDGSQITQRFEDIELFEDRETEVELRTPPRLRSLRIELTGKVMIASRDIEVMLSANDQYEFDTIRTSTTLYQAQLAKTVKGYRLETVGHTGEPSKAQPVQIQLHPRAVQQPIDMTLMSDDQGHIQLGALKNILKVSVSGPNLLAREWTLKTEFVSWPERIHTTSDATVSLPIVPGR